MSAFFEFGAKPADLKFCMVNFKNIVFDTVNFGNLTKMSYNVI